MGINKRLIVVTAMAVVLSLVFVACADKKDDAGTTEPTVTTTVAQPQNTVENTNEGTGYEEEEGLEEAISSQGKKQTTTSKAKNTTTTKKHTTTKATSTSTTKKGTTTTKKSQTTTKKSTTTTLPKAPVQNGEWGVAVEN